MGSYSFYFTIRYFIHTIIPTDHHFQWFYKHACRHVSFSKHSKHSNPDQFLRDISPGRTGCHWHTIAKLHCKHRSRGDELQEKHQVIKPNVDSYNRIHIAYSKLLLWEGIVESHWLKTSTLYSLFKGCIWWGSSTQTALTKNPFPTKVISWKNGL